MMMTPYKEDSEMTDTLHATCPSCGGHGAFTNAGKQRVPAHVAAALGLSGDSIPLWHCSACNSTISEPDLLDITY